jgi:hypothetical protein
VAITIAGHTTVAWQRLRIKIMKPSTHQQR